MADVAAELARDLAMLVEVDAGGSPQFRTWRTCSHTVVVGRSVRIDDEVHVAACREMAIPIVRRPSGGRSVLIGPGTLQYTFALPYSWDPRLRSIPTSKRVCNQMMLAGLGSAARLCDDVSGDLVAAGRKVGGLALKCKRHAMMLHGTLLIDADLGLVERTLKHPAREPAYRRSRTHEEFLANLGSVDEEFLSRTIHDLLNPAD